MVQFEIHEGDNVGEIRVLAEALFEVPATVESMNEVIRVFADCVNSSISHRLGVIVENVVINTTTFRLGITFLQPKVDDGMLTASDLGRLRTNYVFYIFAKVNATTPFSHVAFPEGYTYFINLPQTLEREYGWK